MCAVSDQPLGDYGTKDIGNKVDYVASTIIHLSVFYSSNTTTLVVVVVVAATTLRNTASEAFVNDPRQTGLMCTPRSPRTKWLKAPNHSTQNNYMEATARRFYTNAFDVLRRRIEANVTLSMLPIDEYNSI